MPPDGSVGAAGTTCAAAHPVGGELPPSTEENAITATDLRGSAPAEDRAARPTRARDRATTAYAELAGQVRAAGLMGRRRGYYAVRATAALLASAAVVTGVVLVGDSWWQLGLAAAVGVIATQFAFLGHDGAHRQIFDSPRRNDWAARLFAGLFAGMSYGWWMRKHSKHHGAPNQLGKDTDIESTVIAFHEQEARARRGLRARLTRHQGWLFLPLLLLAGANLHVDSAKALLSRDAKGRWTDVALLTAHWGLYLTGLLLVMSPLTAAAFVAVHLAVLGVCMAGAFAPNHVGMPIIARGARTDFLSRQVLTSRNVTGGVWVDFAMGGLNRQVEHHLFPSMPRPNLRRVQPLVRAFCVERGIVYTEQTLVGSYRSIITHLNEVGLKAGDPFTCASAAQLRA